MIRSNLALLLLERNLKIIKVALDTGISRTTLTALSQNNCKGIHFDTINTLCNYLKIEPGALFGYCPIDVFTNIEFDNHDAVNSCFTGNLYIRAKENGKEYSSVFSITDEISVVQLDKKTDIHEITVPLEKPTEYSDYIINLLKKIPRVFFTDIEKEICMQLPQSVHENDYSLQWTIFEN